MQVKVWMSSLAILIFFISISSINCGSSNPSGGEDEESERLGRCGESLGRFGLMRVATVSM